MLVPRWLFFYVTAFLTDISLFMITLAAPQVALMRFDAPPVQLGALGTCSGLSYALVALVAGWASDHVDRRRLPMCSALAQVLALCAIPFTSGFTSYLALNVLYMAVLGFFWSPMMSLLSVVTARAELSRVLGRYNLSWCSGGLCGAFATGELLERVGPHAPFWVAGCLMLITLTIVSLGRPRATVAEEAPAAAAPHAAMASARTTAPELPAAAGPAGPTRRSAPVMQHHAWLVMSCGFLLVSLTLYLFPKLAEAELHWGPRQLSLLQSSRIGAMLLTFGLLGATRGWHFRRTPYHLCFAVMLVGMAIVAASSHLGLSAAAYFGLGAASGTAYVLSAYYSLLSPSGRGAMMGIHEALLSAGNVLGPILGGWITTATGSLRAPFWWSLLPVLLAWAAYGIWARKLSRL